ncbi:hypothetical protein ACLK17_12580 [Escherichia coli]
MQMCDGARVKKLVHQWGHHLFGAADPRCLTFNILHSRLGRDERRSGGAAV